MLKFFLQNRISLKEELSGSRVLHNTNVLFSPICLVSIEVSSCSFNNQYMLVLVKALKFQNSRLKPDKPKPVKQK